MNQFDLATLWRIGRVSHRLNVSVQRVDQLVDAGRLPVAVHTELGRLFDPAEVERLAKEREAAREARAAAGPRLGEAASA